MFRSAVCLACLLLVAGIARGQDRISLAPQDERRLGDPVQPLREATIPEWPEQAGRGLVGDGVHDRPVQQRAVFDSLGVGLGNADSEKNDREERGDTKALSAST